MLWNFYGDGMTDDESKMFAKTREEMELVKRHIKMLKVTKVNQPIGIIRLSELLDMPKHKVRYSLRILEKEGLIIPTDDGATVSARYDEFMASMREFLGELQSHIGEIEEELDL